MMVTGLPFSLKSSPWDGTLAKSLSKDSETIQPLSFGEILKAKAKQLEQEINVSSAVGALAAMQTSSLPLPMLNLSANKEIYKVDIQPALEKGLPQRLSPQPSSNHVPSQIGKNQETMIFAGTQKDEAQVATLVSGSTSVPSSVQLAEKTEAPAEFLRAAAKSLSKAESTVFSTDTHPDQTVNTGTITTKPDANADAIQGETLRRVGPQTLPEGAAKSSEAKLSGIEITESQARTGTLAVEVHSSPTPVTIPDGQEIIPAELVTKQKTITAETKNEEASAAISVNDFPNSSVRVVRTTETSALEGFTTLASQPPESPTGTVMRPGIERVSTQPFTHEEIVSVPSTEEREMTTLQAAPGQKTIVTEVEKSDYQTGNPVSQTTESVIEETVPFDSDAKVKTSSPSSNGKPDLGSLKISTQPQPSHDFASIESTVERETIPVATKVDMSTFGSMGGVQQSISETSKINNLPVDESSSTAQPSIGKIPGFLTNDMFVETQKAGTQNNPLTPETDAQSSQPVNRSVPTQTRTNQENVKVRETEMTQQGSGAAVTDDVQVRAPVTKNAEMPVSKNSVSDVRSENETEHVLVETVFNTEMPGTTSVQASSDGLPIQYETNEENTIVEATKAGKQNEVSLPAAENAQSTVNSFVDTQIRNAPQNSHRVHAEQSATSSVPAEQNDLPDLAGTEPGKIVVETRTYVPQDDKPVSAVGNPQSDVVVQALPEIDGTHGIEDVQAHISSSIEAIAIPLDQPEVESVLIQKEIRQEKVVSEAEAVIAEPNINGTSDEVLQSKSDTVSTSKEAWHQPSTQTAVLHPQSDVRGAPSGAKQIKTSSENNGVETQSSGFGSVVNVSPAESEIPATTFTRPGADNEADDVIPQTVVKEASSAALGSEFSKVALSQDEASLEKSIIDPQHIEKQVDSNELVVANDTKFNVSKPDFEDRAAVAPSLADTNTKTEFVRYQTVVQATSLKAGADQERPIVNPENVEKLVDADEFAPEVSQSASDSPAVGTSPQAVTDIQAKRGNAQPVAETTRPAPLDVWQVKSFQPEIDMEKPAVDPQIIEQRMAVDESEKASQNVSDIPVASNDAFADGEAQMVQVPTAAQAMSSSDTNVTFPHVVPFQAEAGLEKPLINPEDSEKQVNSPSTVVSQTTVIPAEKTESTNRTGVALEINDQNVVSVSANQELDNRRTISEREARTMIDEASLPASAANKQETPVSVQPDAFTKVDSGKQDLKADPTRTTDEKILPAEKQIEPNEILEFTSVKTNPVKESIVIGSVEKGPVVPMDPHAVEVVQQVIRQLNGRLKSDSTSMHLQLNPDQLGAIEVEMVRDSQGVSVTFFAEQASTGKLLESQLNQLRQSLMDSGVQLSGLNIGQHNHFGQEGGFPHQNTSFAQTPQRETHQREVNTKESPRAERVTGQVSEVDYLI